MQAAADQASPPRVLKTASPGRLSVTETPKAERSAQFVTTMLHRARLFWHDKRSYYADRTSAILTVASR